MINPIDYDYLASFLLASSGLSLGGNKEYLLESRLIPLAQSLGLSDISELVTKLRAHSDRLLEEAVVESMTTSDTSFFRNFTPFDNLRDVVIPELLEKREEQKSLRIWSAAGSTGQEAYSVGMLLSESFPELKNWNVEILVTDLSQQAITRAQEGVYSQFEAQRGLPISYLVKFFSQVDHGWKVKSELKKWFTWKSYNLLDSFEEFRTFDLILCRNVLIYFENLTKKDVLDRMRGQLADDGSLVLGEAETILGISDSYQKDIRFPNSYIYLPAEHASSGVASVTGFRTGFGTLATPV